MSYKLAQRLLVAGFGILLVLPAVDMIFHIAPRSDVEKRTLTPPPPLTAATLPAFPKQFEDFVRDQFGFRDILIRTYSLTQVRLLHRSSVPNVIIGKDGWLFYAGYNDGADISEFQGKVMLPDATLAAQKAEIEGRAAQLAEHGIKYVLAVAPNKHTVYEEALPASIERRESNSFLDQFVRYIRGSKLPFLDLRTALIAAKGAGDGPLAGPLYYKTDSHWNRAGAYIAYRSIVEALGLPPLKPDQLTFSSKTRKGGDLATMLALADDWSETEVEFVAAPHEKLPLTVFLVGDSYAVNLEPFLRETFSNVVVHRPLCQCRVRQRPLET